MSQDHENFVPSELVENRSKAFRMAKVEDMYRSQAKMAEKTGLSQLVQERLDKAKEEAEKVGKTFDETQVRELTYLLDFAIENIAKQGRRPVDPEKSARLIELATSDDGHNMVYGDEAGLSQVSIDGFRSVSYSGDGLENAYAVLGAEPEPFLHTVGTERGREAFYDIYKTNMISESGKDRGVIYTVKRPMGDEGEFSLESSAFGFIPDELIDQMAALKCKAELG